RDRLGRALQRTMQSDGDMANLRQTEHAAVQHHVAAILRIGEGVVAIAPLKARISGVLTRLQATEEALKGTLNAPDDILQDLCIDLGIFRVGVLELREFRLLLIVAGADALPALPPGFALFQRDTMVGAPAPQDRFQRPRLLWRWQQSVLVGLAYRLAHRLLALLALDVPLQRFQRHCAHRADEIRVRPQRGQA